MGGGIWSMLNRHARLRHTDTCRHDIRIDHLFARLGDRRNRRRHHQSPGRIAASPFLSGIFMGLGAFVAMHYAGMAAMRKNAELDYDRLFARSPSSSRSAHRRRRYGWPSNH
jgi:hypothetical protein